MCVLYARFHFCYTTGKKNFSCNRGSRLTVYSSPTFLAQIHSKNTFSKLSPSIHLNTHNFNKWKKTKQNKTKQNKKKKKKKNRFQVITYTRVSRASTVENLHVSTYIYAVQSFKVSVSLIFFCVLSDKGKQTKKKLVWKNCKTGRIYKQHVQRVPFI